MAVFSRAPLLGVLGAIALCCFVAFSALAWAVATGSPALARFDQGVLDAVLAWRSPGRDRAVTWFTDIGATPASTAIGASFALLTAWRWRDYTPIVLMAGATAFSTSLTRLLKISFKRARPDHDFAVMPFEHTYSFPSGHSLNAVVVAGIMAYLLLLHLSGRVWRVTCVVVGVAYPLLMGASRVFLGHHWASDVLAGWCVGALCLIAAIGAHRMFLARRNNATTKPQQRRNHPRNSHNGGKCQVETQNG